MYTIEHIGYGPLTNEGETEPLQFTSEAEAREYLAACDELDNLETDWRII